MLVYCRKNAYLYSIEIRDMTDLQFTQDIIRHDAAHMNAIEFQLFLYENDIEHEWNEANPENFNDGVYDVFLSDFEMSVRFIDGEYMPEEDL